jgi:hypothetical protein
VSDYVCTPVVVNPILLWLVITGVVECCIEKQYIACTEFSNPIGFGGMPVTICILFSETVLREFWVEMHRFVYKFVGTGCIKAQIGICWFSDAIVVFGYRDVLE